MFPSSHDSVLALRPSPQLVTQGCPGVGHVKPCSRVQVFPQPSPGVKFPSSQLSFGVSMIELLQLLQVSAEVGVPPTQVQFGSVPKHLTLQPSPSNPLLSSQTSFPSHYPFPQRLASTHVLCVFPVRTSQFQANTV
jgi:hypothetical protein